MAASDKPVPYKINVRILHVFLSGPPATAAINETTGVRGFCKWKIENREEYLRAVLIPFQDRGGIARSVERGSIVVTVAAENTQVANRIVDDCVAGRIMKEVNDLLDDFDEKNEEKVGNFEKIGVIAEEATQISIEKWIDTKIEYDRNIKKIIEDGLKPYEEVSNQIIIRSRYVESRSRFDENRSKFDESRSVFEQNRSSSSEEFRNSSEESRMKYEANRRRFEHNRRYRSEQTRRITAEESRMRYDDRQRVKKATSSGQSTSYE